MADDAPDLTANLLAALGGAGLAEIPPPPDPVVPLATTETPVPEPIIAPVPAQPDVQAPAPVALPEPPKSPLKRPRTPDPIEALEPEKRQKVDHEDGVGVNGLADLGASNWDIGAMLQNALGSFDEELRRHSADRDSVNGNTPSAGKEVAEIARPKQKRMAFSSDPYYVMRTMSLPLLGSLAIQILLALSQQAGEETEKLIADEGSEFRKAYDTLKQTFSHTKRMFSETTPILSADELEITDVEDRETIRMANLATISTSLFGGDEVTLDQIHDQVLTILIPDDGDFVESVGSLLLGLKTQAILRLFQGNEDAAGIAQHLDKYFPADPDEILRQRSGDATLGAEEEKTSGRMKELRESLLTCLEDANAKQSFLNAHPSKKFVEDLGVFLQGHLGLIIEYAEKYGINIPLSEEPILVQPELNGDASATKDDLVALLQSVPPEIDAAQVDQKESIAQNGDDLGGLGKLIQESLLGQTTPSDQVTPADQATPSGFSSTGLASLIAQKLNNGVENAPHGLPGVPNAPAYNPEMSRIFSANQGTYLQQLNQLNRAPYHSYTQQGMMNQAPNGGSGDSLPPNQSATTSMLYERARQAYIAKSTAHSRREGLHSTRRPWSPEEEKALMAGLDMVKGPHWSQILSLFGPNGSISDILKDRSQVQLKDKARNLKLFFLKTNSEMPFYLQCVTGELKTRAPGQAARKEAEEKRRLNSEDDQARIQGINILAGGLQNNSAQHGSSNGGPGQQPARQPAPALGPSAPGAPQPNIAPTPGGRPATNPAAGSLANIAPAAPARVMAPAVKTEPTDPAPVNHVQPMSRLPGTTSLSDLLKAQMEKVRSNTSAARSLAPHLPGQHAQNPSPGQSQPSAQLQPRVQPALQQQQIQSQSPHPTQPQAQLQSQPQAQARPLPQTHSQQPLQPQPAQQPQLPVESGGIPQPQQDAKQNPPQATPPAPPPAQSEPLQTVEELLRASLGPLATTNGEATQTITPVADTYREIALNGEAPKADVPQMDVHDDSELSAEAMLLQHLRAAVSATSPAEIQSST